MQVGHLDLEAQGLAPPFNIQDDDLPHRIIEDLFQIDKPPNQFLVDTDDHVTRAQDACGGSLGNHFAHYDHARPLGECTPRGGFGFPVNAEPPDLVVGLVGKNCLQGASRHLFSRTQEFKGAFHSIQRQKKTRRSGSFSRRVHGNHLAVDIHHRGTR